MLFSYNWLREFTDIPESPEELSLRLTMAGIEVEGITEAASGVLGVVTAEILSIKKHPNADKLFLCEVRTADASYSIVCGARNMKEGDRVALALPGARIAGGAAIERAEIRGMVSQGMMCSSEELGLERREAGIMILPGSTPLGKDINEVLGLGDFLLDAAVMPNRPDCLSIMGLAREISALTGSRFREKKIDLAPVIAEGAGVEGKVSIEVTAPTLCRRYAARVVEGVKVEKSRAWLERRLLLHGLRAVNNIVDALNYVMLEYGQPLHAFDLDRIHERKLIIRTAGKNETIETIDGKKRELKEGMLVICDPQRPQAVAGVMGGKDSEVTEKTKRVLLESAWFEPSSVRRTSRGLGLKSDSSYRFERGVDIEGVPGALSRASVLVRELSGGVISPGMADVYPEKIMPAGVEFRMEKVESLLGIGFKEAEVKKVFQSLGIGVVEGREKGCIVAVPPSYRVDIKTEADLVEEVARLKGYDKVPLTMPVVRAGAGEGPGKLFFLKKKIREILAASGFLEVINYSFVSRRSFSLAGGEEEGVRILNPLTQEEIVMRKSLAPSLLENLSFNLARKNEEVRLFECGPVFFKRKGLPEERLKAAALLYGRRGGGGFLWNQPGEWVDFYDIKGAFENLLRGLGNASGVTYGAVKTPLFHPGKGAAASLDGREFAVMGELHPDIKERFDFKKSVYLFEMDTEILLDNFGRHRRYSSLPRFPESSRDVAFIVASDIPYSRILDSLRSVDTKLIESIEVFDVYSGGIIPAGKKSLALRITYRSDERTLVYSEVEEIHSRVTGELTKRFNAEIRK